METEGIIDLINTIDWRALIVLGVGYLAYKLKGK